TTTHSTKPIKVNGNGAIGTSTKIVSVSAGADNISAIDSEGNLYIWGRNDFGQLGNGTTTRSGTPIKVNGNGAIGTSTKIVSVSAGADSISAIDSEGNLYTWGRNDYGQLGNGTTTHSIKPIKVNGNGAIGTSTKIVSVSAGEDSISAIDSEGNLYTWGRNQYGQLGNGTTTHSTKPIKVNGNGAIGTSTKIVSIATAYFNISAIDSEGNLYTWGRNQYGQLGNGTTTSSGTPIKVNGNGAIGTSTKIVSIATGYDSISAIDSEGNLYTWGGNRFGQLGNGTKDDSYLPSETLLTLDIEENSIKRREDNNNIYFDIKVPNAQATGHQIAYCLDGSNYGFANISSMYATITIPKTERAENMTIKIGFNKEVVHNVNNEIVIPIDEVKVEENKAISKLAYFKSYGIVLEGAVSGDEKYDDTVKKTLVIKGNDGSEKLRKDIVSTNWYGDGYSGFQAILSTEDIAKIGNIEEAIVQIEVSHKGETKTFDFNVDLPTDDGSGSGGSGGNPTAPGVPPTIEPGIDIGWTSDYYYIQDLPKAEYGNNVISFIVNQEGKVLLTNKVKDSGVNILSYYVNSNKEYVLDVSVKIKDFDLATNNDAIKIFEVKDRDGHVVNTGNLATFADGTFPGVESKSALQAVIPKEYSSDKYTYEIVIKDSSNVEKVRFEAPKFF
ncbi:RCC1 domain-containing protein, partial [Clostridium perfringens]|uniref:RCC1 domain-containing protein n=1 Tax=Clostridium perfringens TaxID=1502 RepID=UPI0039ECF25B